MAINSVPAAKTKAEPNTERMADGKPYVQYDCDEPTTPKKTFADAVKPVPMTGDTLSKWFWKSFVERNILIKYTTSTRSTKRAKITLLKIKVIQLR